MGCGPDRRSQANVKKQMIRDELREDGSEPNRLLDAALCLPSAMRDINLFKLLSRDWRRRAKRVRRAQSVFAIAAGQGPGAITSSYDRGTHHYRGLDGVTDQRRSTTDAEDALHEPSGSISKSTARPSEQLGRRTWGRPERDRCRWRRRAPRRSTGVPGAPGAAIAAFAEMSPDRRPKSSIVAGPPSSASRR